MRTYTINSPEYAAHMNVTHWDTLKSLKIIDDEIYYDTGALIQKVDERIEMFEEHHDQPEYIAELKILDDDNHRQKKYLRRL